MVGVIATERDFKQLDAQRFEQDLESGAFAEIVEVAHQRIVISGIMSVPVVYLNADLVQLDLNLNNLEAAIRLEALSAIEYESEPPMLIDLEASYQATLHLDQGEIVIELYPEKAPRTVENFLQYVKEGHYDGTIFHRVIPGFMVQGGGYTPDMTENPTRPPIKNEARNGRRNSRGTVAMARTSAPDSATSPATRPNMRGEGAFQLSPLRQNRRAP